MQSTAVYDESIAASKPDQSSPAQKKDCTFMFVTRLIWDMFWKLETFPLNSNWSRCHPSKCQAVLLLIILLTHRVHQQLISEADEDGCTVHSYTEK
jgi:hypothetical protein